VKKDFSAHVSGENIEMTKEMVREYLEKASLNDIHAKNLLLHIFFLEEPCWGRASPAYFDNCFSLEVLAFALTMVCGAVFDFMYISLILLIC